MVREVCLATFILFNFLIPICETQAETLGGLESLDPAFDKLVPPGSEIEVLAEGFDWSEGPVWIKGDQCLLFSDIPPNKVHKWKEGEGLSLHLMPSGYTGETERGGEVGSNGLALDADGNLLLCQHGDRRVARLESLEGTKPTYETLADRYKGKRFNSPNDLVIHSNGDIYFTDPPYGLEKNMDDPSKELDFQGVYRLSKDGEVTLLTKEMSRPNGIGLSPDEKTLYVANSDGKAPIWKSFPVLEDGTIGEGKVFHDISDRMGKMKGAPDGMAVDIHGNVFATAPGGVIVLSPEGKRLGTILTENATANCTFGDDGSTLYMTADSYLLRIKTGTKGLGEF